jgi:trimeric autotransporter adhesin
MDQTFRSRASFQFLLVYILVLQIACAGGGQNNATTSGLGVPIPSEPALTSIKINPANPVVPAGSAQQFKAIGQYTDGTTKEVTSLASWTSSNVSVAHVNAVGMATTTSAGTTSIPAALGSIRDSTVLNVSAAPLLSIYITPGSISLPAGTTVQLRAIGVFQDGSAQDVSTSVGWNVSDPNVASISGTGLLRGVKSGSSEIIASRGPISGTANLKVHSAVLLSLSITPGVASIAKHTTKQFSATGQFSDGTSQNLTS